MVESIFSRRFEPFEKNTGFDKATCGEQNFEYIYSCGMWAKALEVRLFINNSYGEQVYAGSESMTLNFKREDGKIEGASGSMQKFFLFDSQDSYGFQVEVLPDAPISKSAQIKITM